MTGGDTDQDADDDIFIESRHAIQVKEYLIASFFAGL